jgi:hypothetical protein
MTKYIDIDFYNFKFVFYIPRIKSFINIHSNNYNSDYILIIYSYDVNIIDKLTEKYSEFKVLKISDNINNHYYDFIVYAINEEEISSLLFYKIFNSKIILNYKIHL